MAHEDDRNHDEQDVNPDVLFPAEQRVENVVEGVGDEHDVHTAGGVISGHQSVVDKDLRGIGVAPRPWRAILEHLAGRFGEAQHRRLRYPTDLVRRRHLLKE